MAVTLLVLASDLAQAMFISYQTKQVPIERVFKNLETKLAAKPNDFELIYQLARLHAMAYSTNLTEMSVIVDKDLPMFAYPGADTGVPPKVTPPSPATKAVAQGHLTNAITHYERALAVVKSGKAPKESHWFIPLTQLGYAWCLDQAGRRNDALDAYRRALRAAWQMEVVGEFDLKEWLRESVEDIKNKRNPFRTRPRGSLGPGVCYSRETIDYMLKLLDPAKDAAEIKRLQEDLKTLTTMGRAITPILVPLEPDRTLTELVDPSAKVTFDLDGSGLQRQWGWITPKAAWLVYDADGSGRITSGLQLFGNVTFWIFWRDGYEALASLDDDGDGVLSGSELNRLALWHDQNSNGICEAGEVRPLADYGITSLSCVRELMKEGMAWSSRGVNFSDGSSRPTFDWVAPSTGQAKEKGEAPSSRTSERKSPAPAR